MDREKKIFQSQKKMSHLHRSSRIFSLKEGEKNRQVDFLHVQPAIVIEGIKRLLSIKAVDQANVTHYGQ